MRYLLDSHVLLWWLDDDPQLGETGRSLIANSEHQIFVSAASVWEMGIKQALGRLRIPRPPVEVLQDGDFEELPITASHADAAARLPPLHRDPFDRMLIAQARMERLTLLTRDEAIRAYDVDLLMV